MKKEEAWFYVAGLAMGVALAATIMLWPQASVAYRIGFLVLLVLLFFAAWSKRKPYESDGTADSKPFNTLISEGGHENDNNANNRNS
jgi:hypothetical protein